MLFITMLSHIQTGCTVHKQTTDGIHKIHMDQNLYILLAVIVRNKNKLCV